MKNILIAGIVLFLSACGTTSGLLNKLPEVGDNNNAGKVVVARVKMFLGGGNGYAIALDGKNIIGIGSGEHTEFFVPVGEHTIAVRCFGGIVPMQHEDLLNFTAKATEVNYFLISANMSCAEIKESTEAELSEHLKNSKQVDLTNMIKKESTE